MPDSGSTGDESHLDVLATAAHPDDVELCCSGTICTLTDRGYDVGVVDFTRGELGTRGTPEARAEEAANAAEIMGLAARENLEIPDGQIENSPENRRKVIRRLRKHRPRVLLINADHCRHPDHCDAAELASDAAYYAGLRKIETRDRDGRLQEPWRPDHVLHYMQAIEFEPTFVVDVSDVWDRRMEALRAYRSQFFHPEYDSDEPETFISNPEFMEWIEARARTLGYWIGAEYGEALKYRHPPVGVDDLMSVLGRPSRFT